MAELCKRVNLIPVVAKADTLTVEERIKFKNIVRKAICDNNIHPFLPEGYTSWDEIKNNLYDNNEDDQDLSDFDEESEYMKSEPSLPFAIISSEEVVGFSVRGREYRWGIAEVENSLHCDFNNVNKVLMSEHMLDLIQTTIDDHYERYRQGLLLRRIGWHNQTLQRLESENCKLLDGPGILGSDMIPQLKVDFAVSEEGGLNALMAIQAFGHDYIRRRALSIAEEAARFERNGGFRRAQYELVVKMERDRLQKWNQDLTNLRKNLENELHTIHNNCHQLISQVNQMGGIHETCTVCELEKKRLSILSGNLQVN